MRGSWVHLRRCCSSCSPLPGRFLKALFPVASRLLEKLSYGKSEQGARRLSGNGLNIARPLLGPMATWLHHLPFWGSKSLCEALVVVQSLSRVWLFVTPWTVACQAPLSMVFARQEYWSGLPFPTPGDLPDPGIYPCLCVSCIGKQILYHCAIQKVQFIFSLFFINYPTFKNFWSRVFWWGQFFTFLANVEWKGTYFSLLC